jgi:hypothetical protein
MENSVFGYREICQGKTAAEFSGKKIVFRHQSIFDQCLIEEEKAKWTLWAKNLGLLDKNEAIKKAIKAGDWTEERESNFHKAIDAYRMMWARRDKAKKVVNIVTHVRSFHQEIDLMRDEIDSEAVQRSLVSGDCYENEAQRKSLDYEINLLSENERGEPFFKEDEFEYLSDGSLAVLRNLYSSRVLKFDEEYFEKLAVSNFFRDLFSNYVDSPGNFFGKPAPDLTIFQISLLRQAKRFSKVLEIAYDAPDDFYEKPIMLETYAIVKNMSGGNDRDASQEDVRDTVEESRRNRN